MLSLRRAYAKFLQPSELVVLCAVVKRLDVGWGVKGRHQLVLTSNARILCLEQVFEDAESSAASPCSS